jgi:ADP-ribose pyrophosphatase YjhB (NUDIX family)
MTEAEVWKPHVTVAAICEHENRFLLVKERVNGQIVLNQPAGHLEPGETLEQAVIRETLEETAYSFSPSNLVGIYRYQPEQTQATYLRFAYGGKLGEKHNQPLDTDIIETQWMSLDEIKQNAEMHRCPMVLQCILDYLHKPSYPLQVFSSEFQ